MRTGVLVALVVGVVALTSAPLRAELTMRTGHATKWRTSPPLRDMLEEIPRSVETGLEVEIPIQIRPGTEQRVDPGTGPTGPVQSAAGETFTPSINLSFEGLSDDDNSDVLGGRVVPPDTNGDIGFDAQGNKIYVQYINLIWAVYDATNGNLIGNKMAGNTFWSGFGGSCETENDGDPIVLYDDDAGRWTFSQFSIGDGKMCWAVSATSDPLGLYHQYEFVVANPTGGTADYPKAGVWAQTPAGPSPVGVNQSAYTQTSRNFPFDSGSFMQAVVLERDKMLAGQPAQFVQFGFPCVADDCREGMLPPHQAGPPPAFGTCPTFFTIVDAEYDDSPEALDGVRLDKLCVDWSDTFAPTIDETFAASSADFDRFLGNGFSDCIDPLPASGEALDCLASFGMFRAQYRWFDDASGTHASVVLNTTVDAGSDRAGIHWMELRSPDGQTNWSVHQESTYAPADGNERWMGSIAQDRDRNIALGFSIVGTSPDLLPSIHYTSRQNGDASGTMGSEEICHTGTGVQVASFNRWGDYSSMSVDPEDDCTFWYTQEYYETSGSFDFTSRICSFFVCSCPADRTIANATISAPDTRRAVNSITTGPAVKVAGSGHLHLIAGGAVQLGNGLEVIGSLTVETPLNPCL